MTDLKALLEAATPKVKPLVWEPYPNPALAGPDVAVANVDGVTPYIYQVQRDPWASSFIAYAAPKFGSETWRSSGHESLDSAKAAAQADHEARILSALEPPSPTLAAALIEAEKALADTTDLCGGLLSETIYVKGQYVSVRDTIHEARAALARIRAITGETK